MYIQQCTKNSNNFFFCAQVNQYVHIDGSMFHVAGNEHFSLPLCIVQQSR